MKYKTRIHLATGIAAAFLATAALAFANYHSVPAPNRELAGIPKTRTVLVHRTYKKTVIVRKKIRIKMHHPKPGTAPASSAPRSAPAVQYVPASAPVRQAPQAHGDDGQAQEPQESQQPQEPQEPQQQPGQDD